MNEIYSIRNWRDRAEELRTIAETLTDAEAKRGLLNAAATYDQLADEADERLRKQQSKFS